MKTSRRAVAAALAVTVTLGSATAVTPTPASAAEVPYAVQLEQNKARDIERQLRQALPPLTPEMAAALALVALVIAGLIIAPVAQATGSSLPQLPDSQNPGDGAHPDAVPGRVYTRSVGSRTYDVILPAGYSRDRSYPIMIGFGGWQHTASQARGYEKLESEAGETIVVYAQGRNNAWGGAPYAATTVSQDVRYVQDVIADVASTYNGDSDRVTAVGLSNGGGMAAALACHAPDTVNAVATVAGAFYDPTVTGCAPGAVPILIMHGTNDDIVSYNGGNRHGAPYKSVDSVYNTFLRKNGCSGASGGLDKRGIRCSADTELETVVGGGHTWFTNPSATAETVRFLNAHV